MCPANARSLLSWTIRGSQLMPVLRRTRSSDLDRADPSFVADQSSGVAAGELTPASTNHSFAVPSRPVPSRLKAITRACRN
jgi:hypothetical protein